MKSPRASLVTDTVPIPFDLPHEITIKKLNAKKLSTAGKAFYNEIFENILTRGTAKQKELNAFFTEPADKKTPDPDAAEVAKVQADPLNGYDPHTLIFYGLEAWTYEEPLPAHKDVDARRELIDDLDDDAVDFYARAILKLTKPSLFQTKPEQEAETKND